MSLETFILQNRPPIHDVSVSADHDEGAIDLIFIRWKLHNNNR